MSHGCSFTITSVEVFNMEKEIDALRAELTHVKEQARSCCCIWCGEKVASYQGIASELPDAELKRIHDECRKHDNECLKNPLLAEIKALDEMVKAMNEYFWNIGNQHEAIENLRIASAKLDEIRKEK